MDGILAIIYFSVAALAFLFWLTGIIRKKPKDFSTCRAVDASKIRDVNRYYRINNGRWLVLIAAFLLGGILSLFQMGAAPIVTAVGPVAGVFMGGLQEERSLRN